MARRRNARVSTGRLTRKTFRNAGFTVHEDGDLTITRSGYMVAVFPKGAWRRVVSIEKGAR